MSNSNLRTPMHGDIIFGPGVVLRSWTISTYSRIQNHGGTTIVEEILIVPEDIFIEIILLN